MAGSVRERLTSFLDEMKCVPMVRERVLRLNPNPEEGRMLRGWNRRSTYRLKKLETNIIGKGAFIQRWGRSAWLSLSPDRVYKEGRRESISRGTYNRGS